MINTLVDLRQYFAIQVQNIRGELAQRKNGPIQEHHVSGKEN